MTRYMLFAQENADGETIQLMGLVEVPPCFTPTEDFLALVRDEMGLIVGLETAEEFVTTWGRGPTSLLFSLGQALLATARVLRDEVRYEQSTLN